MSSTILVFAASLPVMVGLAWVMTVLVDDPSVKVASAVYVTLFCEFPQGHFVASMGEEGRGGGVGKGRGFVGLADCEGATV